jgi:hypothetical protein
MAGRTPGCQYNAAQIVNLFVDHRCINMAVPGAMV